MNDFQIQGGFLESALPKVSRISKTKRNVFYWLEQSQKRETPPLPTPDMNR